MRIVGVIVEYNPLHNGHVYQLKEIKKQFGDDSLIIALMSGNVVQRGEFAIENKFNRAEKTINNGVNIVLQIPTEIVLNSADYFTKGTVEIINRFGITDLVFGSDNDSLDSLKEISSKIHSEEFQSKIKETLKETQSYPVAVEKILGERLSSNDILAISYINSATNTNPNIELHSIKRASGESITSATNIRGYIKDGLPHEGFGDIVEEHISMDDYVKSFKFVIQSTKTNNPFINYIKKNILPEDQTWDEMLHSLSNKSFTKKFIAREIMKEALNLTELKTKKVRLLGLDDRGSEYLSKHEGLVYSKYNKDLDTELRVAKLIDTISNANYTKMETEKQVIKKWTT